MPSEVVRWDLRRIADSLAVQADDDEHRADHLLWRAKHLRKRLVRLHDELDAMGIPDPEGRGESLRRKVGDGTEAT